jgi:uncharacterized membrane protein YqgA involved in biofilm formation
MSGTLINTIAVLIGSGLGLLIGNRLNERIHQSVMSGLGLVTLVIGVQSGLGSGNIIIPLLSLAIGAIIGELLDIDGAFKRFAGWLQARIAHLNQSGGDTAEARARFIKGYVTSSLVFCIGPMTILGAVQNGINPSDTKLLIIKSALDFFGAIAFAASLGIGVVFSSLTIFVVQGALAIVGMLLAGALSTGSGDILTATSPYMRELGATGGLLILGISLILLELKPIRVANYLPALVIAPLLVGLASLLGITIYPAI